MRVDSFFHPASAEVVFKHQRPSLTRSPPRRRFPSMTAFPHARPPLPRRIGTGEAGPTSGPRADMPPLLWATTVAALLTALWGYMRLVLFAHSFLPLTYVLPLLVCVWTRRAWHLWTMAGTFIVFTVVNGLRLHGDAT